VNLYDWTKNLFPLPKKLKWHDIFQAPSSPFIPESGERIANLLKRCSSIKGLSDQLPNFLPILLTSGTPEIAIEQLIDFSSSFRKKNRIDFCWKCNQSKFLIHIFGRSNFLAHRLKLHPEIADKLIKSPFLLKKKSLENMESELEKRIDKISHFSLDEFKKILRQYKYEEYLRISVRDLAKLCTFRETLEDLSNIAICSLRAALSGIIKKELWTKNSPITKTMLKKKNFPEKEDNDSIYEKFDNIFPFTILGMGKLGGHELNYSSDIDLIFVHDNEPITGNKEQDYKIRLKAARILIDVMADVTEDGFLARMDVRLRPGGERSPLVQSLDEMELYYTSRGKLWERQALIKSNPVGGNFKCGEDFVKMIKPFIYRSLLDEEILFDVEKIKNRIEKEHLQESYLNVKLGVGGIREIEFFVQTFQLLYGGLNPELREKSTLEALKVLRKTNLVPKLDIDTLEDAYLFLRKVEHCLQMREEQQTHTLPSDLSKQKEIARNLGYNEFHLEKSLQNFLGDLKDVMGSVRSIFSGLFSREHLEIEAAITNSSRIKNFTSEEKHFIELFSQHLAPLLNESTKNKFQRLFDSINVKINYYRKFSKHPSLISRLTKIAETSEMLWNYLLNHLDLLEEIDNSKLEFSSTIWKKQLSEKIKKCLGNEEEEIDQLRQFKHKITFLLGSAELEGVLSYERTRIGLTMLADIILITAFQLSLRWMKKRYGVVKNSKGNGCKFAIIGLGKLGGSELTYFSDLDLIFIHSGDGNADGFGKICAQEYWVKLIQRLISCLSTMTRTGYAYKLDARLRPSGNAGVLVTPLNAYIKYHENSKPWEHQALIKGRVIGGTGGAKWFKQVETVIKNTVYEWIPPINIDSEINHFRIRKEKEISKESENCRNIKEGNGGLLDIEYLTQLMQLKHGKIYPELQSPETIDVLRKLAELDLLKKEETDSLEYNYKFLRLIENGLRLINDESTDLLDFNNINTETILKILKQHGYMALDLKEAYENVTQNVREIYLKYF